MIFDFEVWVSPYRRYVRIHYPDIPANLIVGVTPDFIQLPEWNTRTSLDMWYLLREDRAQEFFDRLKADGHMYRLKEIVVPRFEEERWRKLNRIEVWTILL